MKAYGSTEVCACMYACAHIHMCVCVGVNTLIHTHTHISGDIYISPYAQGHDKSTSVFL
jgi:hypothetical protein